MSLMEGMIGVDQAELFTVRQSKTIQRDPETAKTKCCQKKWRRNGDGDTTP
jgi:hypothetical protein